jgi:hypothetical protein
MKKIILTLIVLFTIINLANAQFSNEYLFKPNPNFPRMESGLETYKKLDNYFNGNNTTKLKQDYSNVYYPSTNSNNTLTKLGEDVIMLKGIILNGELPTTLKPHEGMFNNPTFDIQYKNTFKNLNENTLKLLTHPIY